MLNDADAAPAAPTPTGNGGSTGATSTTADTAPVPVAAPSPPPLYRASIHTAPAPTLPPDFVSAVRELEVALAMPVWLLVQNERHSGSGMPTWGHMGREVYDGFLGQRHDLKAGGRIALLIDSPGGYAVYAYKLAKLLRNHCGGFTAVVPQYAKSAATLLALGAERIILPQDGELGPLDAQLFDPDREEYASALNEVQSLERLNADALRAVDSAMELLALRTHKKASALLPIATKFVTEMLGALFEKLDTVHYSQMARWLKVAEDYATRLLATQYGEQQAATIAERLVSDYPEHEFPVDPEEAATIGLLTIAPSAEELGILDKLMPYLNKLTVIGRLQEVPAP
jgi:hypothetical protein